MEKEIEHLIEDIRRYISFLKEEYLLDIAICDAQGNFFPFVTVLAPFNSHSNPFCSFIKKYPHLQKNCILQQQKLREANEDELFFSGTCYAGMSEFVHKVYVNGKYLCFISATSYCFDREKSLRRIDRVSSQANLNKQQMIDIFDKVVKRKAPKKSVILPLLSSLANQIELLYLLSTMSESNERHDLLAKITYFILENYSNDIHIEDVANYVNYSKFYVSHLFTKYYHQTLFNYLNNLRIQKAKELLINTDFSVAQIAMLVGFSSSNYFSTIFRKLTKKTPLTYRKTSK